MPERGEQRKYSVCEIDRMRMSVMFLVRGDERRCEDQLRTYMLNGTEPEELQREEAEEVLRRVEQARANRGRLFKPYLGAPLRLP
jgi:hypothetical protein